MTLSLKQIQDSGMDALFSEKEIEKQIKAKLAEQNALLAKTVPPPVVNNLDDVLTKGGKYVYPFGGKKYNISVLTPEQMSIMDNLDSCEVPQLLNGMPPMYKFHLTTALGNKFFVKAKIYQEAQSIADAIFGKCYRISASKI